MTSHDSDKPAAQANSTHMPPWLSGVLAEIERGPQTFVSFAVPNRGATRTETPQQFATRIALMAAAAQVETDAKICEQNEQACEAGYKKSGGVDGYAFQAEASRECADLIRAQALAQKQQP